MCPVTKLTTCFFNVLRPEGAAGFSPGIFNPWELSNETFRSEEASD